MKTLLSVQSHVVHGYVGNRAAVFPLQLRGWDVDVVNTVQLSNNTAYGSWTGSRATAAEIDDMYKGLSEKNFHYDAFLTGYIPSAEGLEVVGKIGQDLKQKHPEIKWLLDPVMGDNGQLYVSETVIPVYKSILKTGAVSLITPNAFEVEMLTGVKLDSKENTVKALRILHEEYRVPDVVISSIQLPGSDKLLAVGSSQSGKPFFYEVPVLDSYFTGTGDLFAALMIDQSAVHPLPLAMKQALTIVYGVLLKTVEHKKKHNVKSHGIKGDPEAMKNAELQIIASRDIILGTEPVSVELGEAVYF